VVEQESAGRYFAVRTLANTDHFSTVKPDGFDHPAHKLLVEFWLRHYGPPLSSELCTLLDLSKEDMRARNLPYFTPALLLALLNVDGFPSWVLNEIRPGSAEELRNRFRLFLDCELRAPGGFKDFDWYDHPDVREAQEFSLRGNFSVVTETHLFRAVLYSESKTVAQIKDYLGEKDFGRVLYLIQSGNDYRAFTPE